MDARADILARGRALGQERLVAMPRRVGHVKAVVDHARHPLTLLMHDQVHHPLHEPRQREVPQFGNEATGTVLGPLWLAEGQHPLQLRPSHQLRLDALGLSVIVLERLALAAAQLLVPSPRDVELLLGVGARAAVFRHKLDQLRLTVADVPFELWTRDAELLAYPKNDRGHRNLHVQVSCL